MGPAAPVACVSYEGCRRKGWFCIFFFFFCGNTEGKIAIRVLVVIYLGSAEFLRDSNIF